MENILKIDINITHACNINCSFCYDGQNKSNFAKELDENLIPYILDLIKKASKLKSICFLGGEPTIRCEKLFLVIKRIRESGYSKEILIYTNGINIDDLLISNIKKFNVGLFISFNPIEKIYNDDRGFNNSDNFNKINANIDKFIKSDIEINANTVILPYYFERTFEIVKMLYNDYKIKNITTPINRTLDYDILDYQLKIIDEQYNLIYDFMKSNSDLKFYPLSYNFINNKPIINFSGIYACGAAEGKKIVIDTDGIIYPCVHLVTKQFRIGDVHNGINSKLYDRLIFKTDNNCNNCDNNGSCRKCLAVSFNSLGTISKISCNNQCNVSNIIQKYRSRIWEDKNGGNTFA